jgi:hypothetical protein
MLWITWRQHRTELLSMVIGAIVLAVATVVLASYVQRVRVELGLDTCGSAFGASSGVSPACTQAALELASWIGRGRYFVYLFFLAPALIGSYVGGPLFAREFERQTHRLAWTQGISRLRWAATILGVTLAAGAVGAVVLAVVGGQTRVLQGITGSRPWDTFDVEGPAFVSFVMFGLAVAIFIGAWRRKILAGMLFGLIAFALVRFVILTEARPNYEPPLVALWHQATPVSGPAQFASGPPYDVPADAWVIRADAVDGRGNAVPQDRVNSLTNEYYRMGCSAGRICDSIRYLNEHDVYQRTLYQPADRYWRFQLYEAGLYLALTAALVAGTLVMLRRRDA